jgi:predicted DNA-binding transcriptional regulator
MLQAGKDYGVRVVRAYENRRVGQVFYPPGLLRDKLVQQGWVERIPSPKMKNDDEPKLGSRLIKAVRERGD